MTFELPPLSLYVHLPWCVRKCPYCDFNSHSAGTELPRTRYVAALERDLEREAELLGDHARPLKTVFIGGGTPSLFTAADIAAILQAAGRHLGLAADAEVTMEANPGTLEHGDLGGYRAAGVNRLSLGAQSFSDVALQRLGRIHGAREILQALDAARRGGFDNINLDLMFGLPGQDVEAGRYDVDTAIALSPEHISWYQLTLEPNTVFHSRPPPDLPDDDLCWEIQETGRELLAGAGYRQYEVSAFARAGRECRHNLNYWRFGDYVAVGAGAHGKLSDATGRVRRYRKPLHPARYMDCCETASLEDQRQIVEPADLAFEFMLNGLRLTDGFAEGDFEARTGLPVSAVDAALQRAREDGLLALDAAQHWRPTEHGMRFLNDLQARFLPPAAGR